MELNKVEKDMINANFEQEIEDARIVAYQHMERHMPDGEDAIDTNTLLHTPVSKRAIFADSLLGDDDTGDGSQLKPYKTLNKALDVIDKVSINSRSVILQGGEDRPHYMLSGGISGFVGAHVGLEGIAQTHGDPLPIIETISGLRISDNSSFIHIKDLEIQGALNASINIVENSSPVRLQGVVMTKGFDDGGLNTNHLFGVVITATALVNMYECTISNARNTAIQVQDGSVLREYGVRGSNNRLIFDCFSSIIFRSNPLLIEGDIVEEKLQGGQIYYTP